MKICRKYLPRLSRKGRIFRNLLTVVALLLFIWALRDFAPPTVALAVRWRAEGTLPRCRRKRTKKFQKVIDKYALNVYNNLRCLRHCSTGCSAVW